MSAAAAHMITQVSISLAGAVDRCFSDKCILEI